MKFFRLFLVFTLVSLNFPSLALCDGGADIVQKNVDEFHKWFEEHLGDFAKYGKPSVGSINRNVSAAHGNDYKTFNSYDKLASTPEGKADLMQKLQLLSSVMAKTAGTSSGPDNAAKLTVVADKLSASSDGDLKNAGKILNDEATAIRKGDAATADNCVSSMSALSSQASAVSGSNGSSSSSNNATSKAFAAMIAGLISTSTGAVGGVFIAALLSLLGLSSNGSIGGIASNGMKSATSGNSADQTGAGVVSGAGSAINSDLNTVSTNARSSITSSGTSGAPSSK